MSATPLRRNAKTAEIDTATHDEETRRLLAHVAVRLGGVDKCAARLGINASTLNHYITGTTLIPEKLVLQIVDLILDDMEKTNARALERAGDGKEAFAKPAPTSEDGADVARSQSLQEASASLRRASTLIQEACKETVQDSKNAVARADKIRSETREEEPGERDS